MLKEWPKLAGANFTNVVIKINKKIIFGKEFQLTCSKFYKDIKNNEKKSCSKNNFIDDGNFSKCWVQKSNFKELKERLLKGKHSALRTLI